MGICACSIKYFLFFFNLIFALGGLLILITGAIIQWNFGYFDDFLGQGASASAIILISVGAVIFIIAFFGCCGAIRESQCMLMMFATCLGIIFAGLVTGSVLGFLFLSSLDTSLKDTMTELQGEYSSNENAKAAWDKIHDYFDCCGVDGPNSWLNGPPDTCECEGVIAGVCDGQYYTSGCFDPLYQFIRDVQLAMAYGAAGTAAVVILGIILSCILAGSIKKSKSSWNRS